MGLRIVSSKIDIYLFIPLLEQAYFHLNKDMDCTIRSLFASW